MSISQSTTQINRNKQSPASKLSASDKEELKRLDASISRISNAIQGAPYILTIPSDYPYPSHNKDPAAWCRNLPFDPDEEHLQYMSFILPEHADSCIVARTEVDEERDRQERERKMNGTPLVKATATPGQQSATKKKISLEAYKMKQAGRITPASADNQKEPVMEKKAMVAAVDSGIPDDLTITSNNVGVGREKKRKSDTDRVENESTRSTQDNAPKKIRMSPPSTPPGNTLKIPVKVPHNLPPKLSPPRIDNHYGLPTMLTPTLPDNIEDELLKVASDSNPSSTEKKFKTTPVIKPEKASIANTGSEADATSKGVPQPIKKPIIARQSEGKKQLPSSDSPKIINDNTRSIAKSATTKQRLIVKLKFKKSKWATVQQILKLPPKGQLKKKQENVKNSSDYLQDHISARPKNALEEQVSRPSEKRRRPEGGDVATPESTLKRAKLTPASVPDKTPRTPSPSLSVQSNLQKAQHHTPRKDQLKSVTMTRTTSTDSNDATPSRIPSTPAGPRIPGPTSAPASGHSSGMWSSMLNRYNDLGRKLKHEARDIFSTGVQPSSSEYKRAAMLNVECVLAFMLAYICSDYNCRQERRRLVSSFWMQTTAMWHGLRKQCVEFTPLYALMSHLGAVMASRVVTATVTEVGNPKEASPSLAQSKLPIFVDHWEILHRCSHEANSKLPVEELMEKYPKTWKGRARGTRPGAWESIMPTDIQGPYYLPIGSDTTPLQAVRFGIAFLDEWIKTEKVDYDLRVKLTWVENDKLA